MYAWTLQVKVPADPVRYHARYRTPGDSRSLCVVRVHGRHPHVIFQHGRREDCSTGAFETLDGDSSCKENTVSIWFCAVPCCTKWCDVPFTHLSRRLCKMPRVSIAA